MTKSNNKRVKQTPKNNNANKNNNKKKNKNINNNKKNNVNNVNNNFSSSNEGRMITYAPNPRPKLPTTHVSLTRCAMKFAMACADPFAPAARGSCVPYGSEPTMKTSCFQRFDVTIGVNGYGAAIVCPTLVKDGPIAFYTDNFWNGIANVPLFPFATVGSNSTSFVLNTGWQAAYASTLPFASTDMAGFQPNYGREKYLVGRIVAGGLRAQYTGTTLNQSGLFSCFVSPHHSSISSMTYTEVIGAEADAVIRAVDREPCSIRWFPITDNEQHIGYEQPWDDPRGAFSMYPLSNSGNQWIGTNGTPANVHQLPSSGTTSFGVGCPIGVVYVTGIAGQTVHMELVQHVEYSGPASSNMLTPVTADVDGTKLVVRAAASMPAKLQAQVGAGNHSNNTESLWSVMYDSLKEAAHETITVGVPALARGVASLLV